MGHVKVTEAWLRTQGVTFKRGVRVQPFGPPDRLDLRDALRDELARRVGILAGQLNTFGPRDAATKARVVSTVDKAHSGFCDSCGEPIGHGHGGWCALCAMAMQKALVASGRLAA